MTSGSLPRRYARAILSVAIDEGKVQPLTEELEKIHVALATEPGVLEALASRSFPMRERMGAIETVLDRCRCLPELRNFLLLLVQKERILLLGEIVRELGQMRDEILKIVRVTVSAPSRPTQAMLESVEKLLANRLKKRVIATGEEDPEIIGGLVLKIGQTIYDGSIRGELNKMKEKLIQEGLN